jgi:hypothetical protein
MIEGVIIKETLTDELFLDYIIIDKVNIYKTNSAIKYWTLINFHSETEDLPCLLSKSIISGWFADMKLNNTKYVIFKDKVLKYDIENDFEKEKVFEYMRSKGIPEAQIIGSSNWNGNML